MSKFPPTYVEGFHNEESVLKMRYNVLEGTELQVSHLSLGGGAFSSFYGGLNEEEAIKTIQDAIKQGINFIDTAPWYGQGTSETILGKALQGIPRKAYYLATKVGRYELDFDNMFNFSTEKTMESFSNTLKRLDLDYVDLIQVHDIEFAPSPEIILNETLPYLLSLKREGKVKYIGATGYPLSVLRDIVESSSIPLNTVLSYCRNTLVDSALGKYIEFFQNKHVGVICASGHGMGLFTNSGPQSWHPASDEMKLVCKKASDYCKAEGVELGRLAIWHSMNQKGAATHVIGVNNRHLLQANLSVLYNGLSKKEIDVLEYVNKEYFTQIKDQHWEGVELARYWNYMNSKKTI
ncbi:uncharacterized protein LOC143922816 isoform X2 [Arctopsyche grandis]